MDQVRQPESLLVRSRAEMLPAPWHPALGLKADSGRAGPGGRTAKPSSAAAGPMPLVKLANLLSLRLSPESRDKTDLEVFVSIC